MNINLSSIAFEVVSRATTDPAHLQDRILEITLLKRAHFEEPNEDTFYDFEPNSFTSALDPLIKEIHRRNEEFLKSLPPVDDEEILKLDIQDTTDQIDQGWVYVLARDVDTDEAIGIGSLSAKVTIIEGKSKTGVLSDAYVLPDYRRHGIYSKLIYEREAVARTRGFTKLVVYPATDGRSKRVLERHGYVNKKEGTDDHYMIKDIRPSMKEHGFKISGERQ